MMKKLIAVLLILALCLIFAFAEGGETSATRTLVVYFSNTGTTAHVAELIASETGADLIELKEVEAYTSADLDWTNRQSRVNKEHDNPALQDVALENAIIENWDAYDTIYVGYPIWWQEAAWPIRHFITANDFSGKTVIPFCTSQASGLGRSGELLAEMAGEGNWLAGMRFSSYSSDEDVLVWVKSLDVNQN